MTPFPRDGYEVWAVPTPPKCKRPKHWQPKRIGIYITRELAEAVVYFEKRSVSREVRSIVRFEIRRGTIGMCRECGCTDRHACPDGCHWVQPDLCSECTEVAP